MSLLRSLKSAAFVGITAIESGTNRNTIGRKQLNQVESLYRLSARPCIGTAIHATPLSAALKHAVPRADRCDVASGFYLDALRSDPGTSTR